MKPKIGNGLHPKNTAMHPKNTAMKLSASSAAQIRAKANRVLGK